MRRRCQSNDDILEQEMGLIQPLCTSLQAKLSRPASPPGLKIMMTTFMITMLMMMIFMIRTSLERSKTRCWRQSVSWLTAFFKAKAEYCKPAKQKLNIASIQTFQQNISYNSWPLVFCEPTNQYVVSWKSEYWNSTKQWKSALSFQNPDHSCLKPNLNIMRPLTSRRANWSWPDLRRVRVVVYSPYGTNRHEIFFWIQTNRNDSVAVCKCAVCTWHLRSSARK